MYRLYTSYGFEIIKPLAKLANLPKKQVINLNDEQIHTIDQVKELIKEDIALSYPDYDDQAPLELHMDAITTGTRNVKSLVMHQWRSQRLNKNTVQLNEN